MAKKKRVQIGSAVSRTIGGNIATCRQVKGLSQSELAAKVKASVSFVSMLERGMRSPSVETLVRVAKVLSVRPGELFE